MIRALSSLSDPADLAALLEAGGSRDVRVESIEVPVRFPAIGSLVDLSLALLAVMGHAKIIAEDARAITEDLESALAPLGPEITQFSYQQWLRRTPVELVRVPA